MLSRIPAAPGTACNDLPGGVRARRLDGVAASLENLLAGETEGRDSLIEPRLFEGLSGQPVIEYDWPGNRAAAPRFPMPYTDASMVAASFAVPLADLRPLLPATHRLSPARITPWHGLLTVFAFHHHRSGLGRYQELGIATPMLLDQPRLPFWPLAFDARRAGSQTALGLYPLEMPCDRSRAAEAGLRLYGLPRLLAHAEFALGSQTGLASLEIDGQRLAALEVSAPRSFLHRRLDLSFTMFSLLEGRLIRNRHAMITDGYRGARGMAKVEFGEHPRFAPLRSLRLMHRPLETRVCSQLNLLVGGPEDLGPA
jgi:hypothetical protein